MMDHATGPSSALFPSEHPVFYRNVPCRAGGSGDQSPWTYGPGDWLVCEGFGDVAMT